LFIDIARLEFHERLFDAASFPLCTSSSIAAGYSGGRPEISLGLGGQARSHKPPARDVLDEISAQHRKFDSLLPGYQCHELRRPIEPRSQQKLRHSPLDTSVVLALVAKGHSVAAS
jgi:hypothetical protein